MGIFERMDFMESDSRKCPKALTILIIAITVFFTLMIIISTNVSNESNKLGEMQKLETNLTEIVDEILKLKTKTSDFSPEELEFRIKRQLIELKENFSETSDEINARIDSLEEENYELKKNLAKISSNFSSLESSKMIMEEELARRATEISSMNMSYLALAKKQQDDLTLVKKALVPIGFIYTQYPNQSPPNLLWPDFRFQEVTNNYAGLFFRAEGSGSAPFGQTQAANQSEIASIWTQCINNVGYRGRAHKEDAVTPGVWSVSVCGSALHDMRVFKTRGEVRPKNTAIKIWKRVQ